MHERAGTKARRGTIFDGLKCVGGAGGTKTVKLQDDEQGRRDKK